MSVHYYPLARIVLYGLLHICQGQRTCCCRCSVIMTMMKIRSIKLAASVSAEMNIAGSMCQRGQGTCERDYTPQIGMQLSMGSSLLAFQICSYALYCLLMKGLHMVDALKPLLSGSDIDDHSSNSEYCNRIIFCYLSSPDIFVVGLTCTDFCRLNLQFCIFAHLQNYTPGTGFCEFQPSFKWSNLFLASHI